MTEEKEEFYIKAITDNIILDPDEYYRMKEELKGMKELQRQIEIYMKLFETIVLS